MTATESDREAHLARSAFVRGMVQRVGESAPVPAPYATRARRVIVQFWDDLGRLPSDVRECIESWNILKSCGFDCCLFDNDAAKKFIASRLSARHERAYLRCYHPAMRSDYFRLCYMLVEGGFYLDADDVYTGTPIEHLFDDGRLKVQPLCYDAETDQMVSSRIFTEPGANAPAWIFYFNNNPLLAAPGHPVIDRALESATAAIECAADGEHPEIQSTTGPGNLTRTIFELSQHNGATCSTIQMLPDWEDFAISRWPLSYRNDRRNWRLSNRERYQPPERNH